MGCAHSGPDPVQDKLVLGLAIKTSSSWNRKMPDPKASCRHEWGGGDPSRGCGVWGPRALGRTLRRVAQEPAG